MELAAKKMLACHAHAWQVLRKLIAKEMLAFHPDCGWSADDLDRPPATAASSTDAAMPSAADPPANHAVVDAAMAAAPIESATMEFD